MGDEEAAKILLVEEWDIGALKELFRAGGWWKEEWDPSALPLLIRSTYSFAVAVDQSTGRTIGMGRVISDGVSDAYIQDLVVLPEYRGKGVGSALLRQLVEFCRERGITWIALIAEPETEEFYQNLGFFPMKGFVPMLYKEGESGC